MAKSRSLFSLVLKFLYLISFLVIIYYLIDGISFYLTPYSERPFQGSYRIFRPAGYLGHAFGVIGSAMMIIMLLYSIRKRFSVFEGWGPLSSWLHGHIYLGIIGPLFIILHTSFKVSGLVAVSFWSMIAVALSGVLGRYIYLQIPRTISGTEMSLNDISEIEIQLTSQLKQDFNLESETLEKIETFFYPSMKKTGRGLTLTLLGLLKEDALYPLHYLRARRRYSRELQISGKLMGKILKIFRRKALIRRRISLWNRIHQIFHYWHIFHKPFALVMFIVMFVHILIAVLMGYVWVF